MSAIETISELLGYEELLNRFSGKRYHLVQSSFDPELFSLKLIHGIGIETVLMENVTSEKLLAYIKKNLKVQLI